MRIGSKVVLKETVIVVTGMKAQTLPIGTKGILKMVHRDAATLQIGGTLYSDIPIQSLEQEP